jgi:peptidoglycan/LPS O-acetylase OafA/YrhL
MQRYRNDINGLRAMSVLLVLLFHGGVPGFTSGFIGVDIFFVISGFLITSIIHEDLQEGTFSLRNFYVRRLWRIQVALMATVAFTMVIATAIYLPDDYNRYYKSAIQTVIAGSNRFFASTTTAYGASDSEVLLLLHTWSLSIEWQWYLILPGAMWALNRVASPRAARVIALVLTVVFTALALDIAHNEGSSAYYGFLPRIFEFLFGATLALHMAAADSRKHARWVDMVGIASLGVLVVTAHISGVITEYPNLWTVLVCAASAFLLWAGQDTSGLTSRLLSWAPLVFIGEISYSLYLWHWPIFATARYIGFEEGLEFKLVCFTLTFVGAWLCYRYIEKPSRRLRLSLPKTLGWLVILPLLLVTVFYGVSHKFAFFPGRFDAAVAKMDSSLDRYSVPLRRACMKSREDDRGDLDRCLVTGRAPATILMFGDSYSNQSWNFLGVLAGDAGLSLAAISTPSCLALPDISMQGWWKMNRGQYQVCMDHIKEYYHLVDAKHYRYVILGENWLYYDPAALVEKPDDERSVALGRQRLELGVREALDRIVHTGAIPVLLKSPAPMPQDYETCFYRAFKLRERHPANSCTPHWPSDEASLWFDGMFERLKVNFPSLVIIDPKDAECAQYACVAELDGAPVYRDAGHLTDYASYVLAQRYLQRVGNPFKAASPREPLHALGEPEIHSDCGKLPPPVGCSRLNGVSHST